MVPLDHRNFAHRHPSPKEPIRITSFYRKVLVPISKIVSQISEPKLDNDPGRGIWYPARPTKVPKNGLASAAAAQPLGSSLSVRPSGLAGNEISVKRPLLKGRMSSIGSAIPAALVNPGSSSASHQNEWATVRKNARLGPVRHTASNAISGGSLKTIYFNAVKLFQVLSISTVFVTLATAQGNLGGISGTILDSTGAVVPHAQVTIVNNGTNQKTRLKTSTSGTYSAPSLNPVTYTVTVEAEGFKKSIVEAVKVDTATTATVDVTLQPGAITSSITVAAETAPINTESGTAGTTINQRQITDAPLFNRSVLDLALTQPNVMGDAGTENPAITSNATVPGYNLSVNGGRPGSSTFLADGVNNTGVSYGRTMVSFTPETVQEFSIQTSAYSAEFSQTGGGVINVTTKSGTNDLHGTVLWYNRNPAFASAPFTLATINRSPPTLKYNQFSASAGGPLWIPKLYNGRNKTFWFAAYEPQYRRDFLAQDALNPTREMLHGDFSNTVVTASGTVPASVAKQFNLASTGDATIYNQFSVVANNQFKYQTLAAGQTYQAFPGNIIPASMLDSSFIKATKYIPTGQGYYTGSNGNVFNLFNPRLLSQDDKRLTVRLDHILSEKQRLNGRYTQTPVIKTQVTPTDPTGAGAEYSWARQLMMNHNWTLGPSMLNDLRLNYTRGKFSSTVAPEFDPFTGKNLNGELGLPNILPGGVPSLPFIGGQGSTNNNDVEERYSIANTFTWIKGSMTWKFGVDISHSLQNVTPLYGAIGGVFAFSAVQTNNNGGTTGGSGGNSFASFALGVPSGLTIRSALVPYYYRWNSRAGFVQNDWKVKPNLTLNFGLRYDLQMPRTEKFDHQGAFLPSLAQTFNLATPLNLADGSAASSVLVPPFAFVGKGGRSRYLYSPSYMNFEPRFGIAYSPGILHDKHVTLRGGFGLSHAPVTGFKRLPSPDFGANATTFSPTTGAADSNYITRLGENPPVNQQLNPDQAIFGVGGVPPNGLVYQNSLYYQQSIGGFAVSDNVRTPYSMSWNLAITWLADRKTSVEFAYVGNRGVHLFMPYENINPKSFSLLNALNAQNINTVGTLNDPLGRVNPATGRILAVQNSSLGSPFLGFSSLTQLYDSSATSIRHAGYVNFVRRAGKGLTLTANYTRSKSIDDASDSGSEKNVITTGRVDGQVAFGGTRRNDRSVSIFDQRHVFNVSGIYDLPFGKGQRWGANWSRPAEYMANGWVISNIFRLLSGPPAVTTLGDANQLGDLTHTVRPDLVAGQPVINPLYNSSCPIGTGCQPYLNPSAFMRPSFGQLGNAPRTLDGARGPWNRFFDASIQKNFSIGERKRLQFRVDFLNAFNHPVFRILPNAAGNTDLTGNTPNTGALTATDYNTWAAYNNQPLAKVAGDPGNAVLSQINATINGVKTTAGGLPTDFFHLKLPANFWGTNVNSYDVRTVDGFRLFRMKQAYSTGFGDLFSFGQPRYIQFGLKFIF